MGLINFVKTIWNNGGPPGISAHQLNRIENGIKALDDLTTATAEPNKLLTLNAQGKLPAEITTEKIKQIKMATFTQNLTTNSAENYIDVIELEITPKQENTVILLLVFGYMRATTSRRYFSGNARIIDGLGAQVAFAEYRTVQGFENSDHYRDAISMGGLYVPTNLNILKFKYQIRVNASIVFSYTIAGETSPLHFIAMEVAI